MGNVVTVNGVEKRAWKSSSTVKENVIAPVKDFEGKTFAEIEIFLKRYKEVDSAMG